MNESRAEDQAKLQVAGIVKMYLAHQLDWERFEELKNAKIEAEELGESMTIEELDEFMRMVKVAGEYSSQEEVLARIQEDALIVQYRSDWESPGEELKPSEFRILLCTGGPHVELLGDIGRWGEADNVRVVYRDWGECGEYFPDSIEHEALMFYVSQYVHF